MAEKRRVCSECKEEKEQSSSFFYRDGKNKEGFRTICKVCENKKKIKYRQKESSKQRRRQYEREYYKKKRNTDPSFKLRKDVSTVIRRSLKQRKNDSIWNFLPYTPDDLRMHLESQFDQKMNWENHGSYWHIDHIEPQIKLLFDSYEHPNFLKCWSLDNLRPLEKTENLKKSSIYSGIKHRSP